jgi:hypothetical protein
MKKVLLGLICFITLEIGVYAQPVSDNAVIPMGITLTSVLRLNVISGGNIEFVFTSVYDFQNGLAGDMYRTNLTVESSTNWALSLYASDFSGSAGTIPIGVVDYCFEDNTSGNALVTAVQAPGTKNTLCNVANLYVLPGDGTFIQLTNGSFQAMVQTGDGNDGVAADNNFYIRWRCGVGPGSAITPNNSGAPLINNTVAVPGRSSTNVLVSLSAN